MKRVCKNCERYPCIKNSAMQPEDKCTYPEDFIPRKNMIKKDIDILVEELTQKYIFKTTMEDETIYFYNDGIYHDWGEVLINRFLEEKKSETISSHEANEIVFHIKNNSYVSRKEFNTNKNFIHLQNGMFNLQNMVFEEFRSDIISTNKIPVFYDEKMDCPMIKKFLSEILKTNDIDVMQELFGYLLLKDYNIQKAFMFIGDGANAKTTLLNLFKAFIGEDNISAVSLQKLLKNDFALAELYGKLANIHDDISDKALSYTGGFKMLTGGGTISAEKKYKKPFTFTNYAKLIFTTNKLPETHDKTSAFFRRWIPVNFPNVFEGNKKDTNILDKITTQNELSGLFNWAIIGLKRLMENGCFSHGVSTDEMCVLYEKMSNSLFAFVQDRVVVDVNGFVSKEDFYNTFCEYCKDNGLPIKAKAIVTQELPQSVPSVRGEQKRTKEEGRVRGWHGIKIVKEDEKNDENDGVEQVAQPQIEKFSENKGNGVAQLEQPKQENFSENKKDVEQMAQPKPQNFLENNDDNKGLGLINDEVEHMEQPFLYCSKENRKKDIKVFDSTLCQPFPKDMAQVEQPKSENFSKNDGLDKFITNSNKLGKFIINHYNNHKGIPIYTFERDVLLMFPNANPEKIREAYNILKQQEEEA